MQRQDPPPTRSAPRGGCAGRGGVCVVRARGGNGGMGSTSALFRRRTFTLTWAREKHEVQHGGGWWLVAESTDHERRVTLGALPAGQPQSTLIRAPSAHPREPPRWGDENQQGLVVPKAGGRAPLTPSSSIPRGGGWPPPHPACPRVRGRPSAVRPPTPLPSRSLPSQRRCG